MEDKYKVSGQKTAAQIEKIKLGSSRRRCCKSDKILFQKFLHTVFRNGNNGHKRIYADCSGD